MTYMEQQQMIKRTANEFPSEFGLRGFPGEIFSISRAACFVNDDGGVMLYTQIKTGGSWSDFAKTTVEELRREIT